MSHPLSSSSTRRQLSSSINSFFFFVFQFQFSISRMANVFLQRRGNFWTIPANVACNTQHELILHEELLATTATTMSWATPEKIAYHKVKWERERERGNDQNVNTKMAEVFFFWRRQKQSKYSKLIRTGYWTHVNFKKLQTNKPFPLPLRSSNSKPFLTKTVCPRLRSCVCASNHQHIVLWRINSISWTKANSSRSSSERRRRR